MQSLEIAANKLSVEVTKVISILLPRLAHGFQRQKGEIFGFGDSVSDEETAISLSMMNQKRLENAPINNLDSERSVAFINYELTQRGSHHLQSASTAQVKAKSQDLTEKLPSGSFGKYTTKAKIEIPTILKNWNEKQKQLKEEGLQAKEIANIALDKRRNKD